MTRDFQSPDRPSRSEAESLEQTFGEDARIYAETRSKAAEMRGARSSAEHWQEVEQTLEEDADDVTG